MTMETREEHPAIFTEKVEAELSDRMKKLLLEVIDKGRINLEHGAGILSEVIARGRPKKDCINTVCSGCKSICEGCNTVCSGCNNAVGCGCTKEI